MKSNKIFGLAGCVDGSEAIYEPSDIRMTIWFKNVEFEGKNVTSGTCVFILNDNNKHTLKHLLTDTVYNDYVIINRYPASICMKTIQFVDKIPEEFADRINFGNDIPVVPVFIIGTQMIPSTREAAKSLD